MKNEKPKTPLQKSDNNGIRLNKYLAASGICNRRKADIFIANGLVSVDDKVVKSMGFRVMPGQTVTFDGKVIRQNSDMQYLLLNKPKNVSISKNDESRKSIFDIINSPNVEALFPVDHITSAATGLLLLTNDENLREKLVDPKKGVKQIYHLELDKDLTDKDLSTIRNGVEINGQEIKVKKIDYLETPSTIGLETNHTGERLIEQLFEQLNYKVNRLDRVYYGGLTKKDLKRGWFRKLTNREIIMLKHFS